MTSNAGMGNQAMMPETLTGLVRVPYSLTHLQHPSPSSMPLPRYAGC